MRRHLIIVWAILGVVLFLAAAVVRLTPMAIEALRSGLGPLELTAYAASVVFLAWSEGYKGFQLAFSPRVVVRAWWIADNPRPLLVLSAPLVAMGMVYATRKRLLVNWTILIMVVVLVALVRGLDQPWRGIVDAGVVVGLTWGTVAILVFWWRAAAGALPAMPHDMPERSGPARESAGP